ncbi:MAG: CO dehydrogenase/CO-methylating acetyl-CoA synthase complex subunit beta [Candidatus Latescibacterota bacterium]|nr:MAG: CO dehydrogenase/CO-methylating acetyl-CoA synthase complex subunit beta [Candidatus Latescibacterota bacterium]
MSRLIAAAAIRGAHKFAEEAERRLTEAIEDKGEDCKVEFPDTAFYFPMANALLGAEVRTLGDARKVLDFAKSLLPEPPSERLWLPYLGPTLDAGIATLLCQEIITGVRYLYGEEPQPDCEGFFTDTWQRKLGIQLVDGRMPGFAAILGAAPDVETAVYIIRELQKRNLLIFVGSSVDGRSIIDQLKEAEVEMGWDTYIVPYGRDTTTAIYPLNWAIRAAMIFGGIKPGNGRECLLYTKERVFAFGLTLGEVDDLKYATGAGAINMGFPIIADTPIPEIRPSGICTYEHVVHELDYERLVPRAVEVRGVKVKVTELDIPVPYSAAFEGETVRREQMYVEFGGKYSTAFEYLVMRDMDEIEDGKIELIGPDVDTAEEGSAMPLGILVEVAGRRMQKDFESIMERQIHTYLNEAMGIFHMGQRNLIWMRISKEAYHKGFRLKHFGTILHARFHEVYGQILDKVAVTIYTDEDAMKDVLEEAVRAYNERDERILGMTDEEVDTFYSCTLCQSYAPNHVCIISPERLGLCGAYSWLDARTNYEINPAGPNQPVPKGRCIDPVKGEWEGVNKFVYEHSNRTKERLCIYSLMDAPMTSCGCFECILAIIPEANGFMIVNREYTGMTPCGMKFSTLAGSVGGGSETPGFLGVGRLYVVSRKFISADGGLPRLVWMTKELKEFLADRLRKRCEEIGMPDLIDKIADETVATTSEELLAFLEKVGHPALTMPPLM